MPSDLTVNPLKTLRTGLGEGQTISNKKTIAPTSQPNPLDQYASYSPLFTLSAINRSDLYTLKYQNNGFRLHDIIARSGGIGGNVQSGSSQESIQNLPTENTIDPDGQDVELSKEELKANRNQNAVQDYVRSDLTKGLDLFITSARINTVPIANDDRQMTSATKIEIELHEPYGLSFNNKIRGAALNMGYENHLTAPFLLTIQYKGYDQLGNAMAMDDKYTRHIPIKFSKVRTDLNQNGSIYTVEAVPFSEYGFVNRFNRLNSDINLNIEGKTLADICRSLTKSINDVESSDNSALSPGRPNDRDYYLITCDPSLGKMQITNDKFLDSQGPAIDRNQGQASVTTNNKNSKKSYRTIGQFAKGTGISSILKDVMKCTDAYRDYNNMMKEWDQKATESLAQQFPEVFPTDGETNYGPGGEDITAKDTIGGLNQKQLEAFFQTNEDLFYVNWFRVSSSIRVLENYDYTRKDYQKIIHFHIEPYKIHILNLNQPGISSKFDSIKYAAGLANRFVSRKRYNYIFTGLNTDILDFNLTYNTAYFSPVYKSPDPARAQTDQALYNIQDLGSDKNTNPVAEPELPNTKDFVFGGKTSNSGVITQNPAFDLFLDGYNNPTGDLVSVEMTVHGDPVYLSANQFNLMNTPTDFRGGTGPGVFSNSNVSSDNTRSAYDSKTGSYNLNIAEPFVTIFFKFPEDLNLSTGAFNIKDSSRVPFNGLYRITGIDNLFEQGKFRQVLKMSRFKDQGIAVSRPNSAQSAQGLVPGLDPAVSAISKDLEKMGYKGVANFFKVIYQMGKNISKLFSK